MATQLQTYTAAAGQNQIPQENAEYYSRTLLDRLLPELQIFKYGEKGKGIPKNSGDTISFRRFNSLATATTALVEGVTPDGVNSSVTKISATVKQYGSYITTTDYMDVTALDPVLTEYTQLIGEQAGQSLEIIVRDIVAAGTNVLYAGGKASRVTVASTDKITALDILKIRRQFKRSFVKPLTAPGGKKAYIALAHTDVITDLMQTQEWKDQNTYTSVENRIEGTAGQLYGVYFVEYDYAPKFAGAGASGCDVYGVLVLGAGGFGVPDIEGSSKPQVIAKGFGSAGTNDPLDQRASVGQPLLLVA
jgi:N4-gp56 family major capsid protein